MAAYFARLTAERKRREAALQGSTNSSAQQLGQAALEYSRASLQLSVLLGKVRTLIVKGFACSPAMSSISQRTAREAAQWLIQFKELGPWS